jgi:hypothetical protein
MRQAVVPHVKSAFQSINHMRISKNVFIPTLEIIIGLTMLVRELYQMTVLPSVQDRTLELISFFKYKENTYSLIFLWSIVLIIGIVSIKNNKRMWTSNHVLIVSTLCGSLIGIILSLIYKSPEGLVWGLVAIGTLNIDFINPPLQKT